MTRLGFAISMVALVATASWAYHINYRTKMALERVDKLRAQIAAEREATGVLEIEWAYLNAPDRLTRLVELNNDRLGLAPLNALHFDDVTSIPFPPPLLEQQLILPSSIVIGPGPVVHEPSSNTLATAPMPQASVKVNQPRSISRPRSRWSR